jgi:hypothetical protein
LPDISSGRIFCKWLRDTYGIDTDALPTCLHVFEDGRRVPAKAYPESLLADFRKHFREEWLPSRALDYFLLFSKSLGSSPVSPDFAGCQVKAAPLK